MAKNLQQASKKAIHESKVSELDSLGSDMADFDEFSLSAIEFIAGEFISRVLDNIDSEDMIISGKIADIQLQVEDNSVNIYAASHLIYQDRGVNGAKEKRYDTVHSYTDKMPPVEIFKNFIKQKNLSLRNNATYYGKESPFKGLSKEEQINQAAWGMAMNIFNYGFKPRNIYSKEIPKLVSDLEEQIPNFVMQQVSQQINVKPSAVRIIL